MNRIAIIGGGISGLSAAFTLEQHRRSGVAVEYVLYESSPHLGGVLRTEHIDGCVVEAGPDSFLTEKPWATELCRAAGLGDQLIGSNDADRKTYILLNGKLIVIPDGLMFLVPTKIAPTSASPLFSWKTKLQIAREFFYTPASTVSPNKTPNPENDVILNARTSDGEESAVPPRAHTHDESVAAFIERHYGREMVERLADPLLSGVYGGEAANLSVRAVLPRFAEMERTHGSLTRAMLAAQKKLRETTGKPAPSIFTSLKNGMQQLPDAVAQRLTPSSIFLNTTVQGIQPNGESWVVSAGLRSDEFDAIVLAIPAYSAASLLRRCAPELSAELAAIEYTSSITVALGYDRTARQSLPPGFGFLVPRNEQKRLLAATFVHNKFPHRAPQDRALLRCFFAGPNAAPIWDLTDSEIIDATRNELRQILNLTADPLFARVFKWRAAMAQYTVGHLDRLDRIEHLRRQIPGIALAGNAYRGIGVPDCVRSGRDSVAQTLS